MGREGKQEKERLSQEPAQQCLFWPCVLLVMAALAWGCGGRVSPDPDPDPEPDKATATSEQPTAAADGGDTTGGMPGIDPSLPLGECVEGWQPWEAACPWFASNDRCYATKAEACACLCPRDRQSICASGLPGGADSRTWVSCD